MEVAGGTAHAALLVLVFEGQEEDSVGGVEVVQGVYATQPHLHLLLVGYWQLFLQVRVGLWAEQFDVA